MIIADRLAAFGRALRHAGRTLHRNRAVTAIVTITLAIGIGANAAVFGLVSSALLREPPYADPARLVTLWPRSMR
jgi:hypothetical protein